MKRLFIGFACCVVLGAMFAGCGGGEDSGGSSSVLSLGPNIAEVSEGRYIAGLSSEELEFIAAPSQAGRQRQQNWCWAACIQMILNYHGIAASQEEIVEYVFGAQVDQPGSAEAILYMLDDWIYVDIFGNYYYGSGTVSGELSATRTIDLLSRRWPLILGLSNVGSDIGHAYLLTGVYFTLDADGEPIIDTVVVRDPWPYSDSRQEMSAGDVGARFLFAATLELTAIPVSGKIPAGKRIVGRIGDGR